jgi:hypothetical protein
MLSVCPTLQLPALSRGRFVDSVKDLNATQLNWRLHPGTLTLGEAALHVAGVEVSFIAQLTDTPLDAFGERLRQAATEGVVNDNPFPFSTEEITPELVSKCLDMSKVMVEPVITAPSDELRLRTIKSALGPMIDGTGALARLAFHPGYHQGQAHLIASAPGFPG